MCRIPPKIGKETEPQLKQDVTDSKITQVVKSRNQLKSVSPHSGLQPSPWHPTFHWPESPIPYASLSPGRHGYEHTASRGVCTERMFLIPTLAASTQPPASGVCFIALILNCHVSGIIVRDLQIWTHLRLRALSR